jgi:glycosyltransferase involved in cell wall biosynthesis
MLWVGRGDAERNLTGGEDFPGRLARLVRRRLARRGFHVALTGEMAKDLALLGLPQARVIPTPVDTEAYRPPSATERSSARGALGLDRTPAVVFAGHLVPEKGVHHLIRAVAELRRLGRPSSARIALPIAATCPSCVA